MVAPNRELVASDRYAEDGVVLGCVDCFEDILLLPNEAPAIRSQRPKGALNIFAANDILPAEVAIFCSWNAILTCLADCRLFQMESTKQCRVANSVAMKLKMEERQTKHCTKCARHAM